MTNTSTSHPLSTNGPAPAIRPGLGAARFIAAMVAVIIAGLVFVLATRSPKGDDGFGVSPLLGKPAKEIQGINALTGKPVSLSGFDLTLDLGENDPGACGFRVLYRKSLAGGTADLRRNAVGPARYRFRF